MSEHSFTQDYSFWSYESCKRLMATPGDEDSNSAALKVLFCGGLAGIVTWASVFPLDVIKTRMQANTIEGYTEGRPLLESQANKREFGAFKLAREVYRTNGLKAFYRGLGVCSLRAFIVNAAQVCIFASFMGSLLTT